MPSIPIFADAMRQDPCLNGWTWIPSSGSSTVSFVASEGWYPDKGGRLVGPPFAASADPLAFYRLRFRTSTTQRGYWAVFTQDATGANQVDDAYASIEPSDDWLEHDVVVRQRAGAVTLSITFQGHAPIAVADVVVTTISAAEAALWADQLYAGLPPLRWSPPEDRWRPALRTLSHLRAGGDLRIVQLGDSIVNDTNNGNWDALVSRRYPASRLRLQTSVRGTTGCWFYQQPDQFEAYVTRHRPDLLLIGGISNCIKDQSPQQALADVRTVALRAREAVGCDVVLMSGPAGADWRTCRADAPQADLPIQDPPPVPAFYRGLEDLAADLGVGFIDCHRAWHQYLGASQKPWQWFHRDTVHANDRGKQIIARILDRWFADSDLTESE